MSTRKHWRGPPRWPRAPGPDPSTPMPYETIRNVYEYVEQRQRLLNRYRVVSTSVLGGLHQITAWKRRQRSDGRNFCGAQRLESTPPHPSPSLPLPSATASFDVRLGRPVLSGTMCRTVGLLGSGARILASCDFLFVLGCCRCLRPAREVVRPPVVSLLLRPSGHIRERLQRFQERGDRGRPVRCIFRQAL